MSAHTVVSGCRFEGDAVFITKATGKGKNVEVNVSGKTFKGKTIMRANSDSGVSVTTPTHTISGGKSITIRGNKVSVD